MTGHEPIWALRRAGRKPAFVWVSDFPWAVLDGVTVRVTGEVPELLDLRFLVGTTTIVEAATAQRAQRIAAACHGLAARVIANVYDGRDVTQITDTQGVLTWPN